MNTPYIDFCGEIAPIARQPFTIGRDADLVLDDNRHLHRHFLSIDQQQGLWLLANVGGQLTATVSDAGGRLEAFLAPGAVLPLVFDHTVVRFTAGYSTSSTGVPEGVKAEVKQLIAALYEHRGDEKEQANILEAYGGAEYALPTWG